MKVVRCRSTFWGRKTRLVLAHVSFRDSLMIVRAARNCIDRFRLVNVTLSVSLKESWTNETMPFAEIDRGDKPLVKDNSLWADNATNRLYQWDGQGPYFGKDGASNPKMWSFEPDGSGKGEWSTTQ